MVLIDRRIGMKWGSTAYDGNRICKHFRFEITRSENLFRICTERGTSQTELNRVDHAGFIGQLLTSSTTALRDRYSLVRFQTNARQCIRLGYLRPTRSHVRLYPALFSVHKKPKNRRPLPQ
jgi:hypothetical protein